MERCRSQVIQLSRTPTQGREDNLKQSVVKALMVSLQHTNAQYSASCAAYTQCKGLCHSILAKSGIMHCFSISYNARVLNVSESKTLIIKI